MLEDSLAILSVLADGNYTASECMVNKSSAISVLLYLCQISPIEDICAKAMNVLLHIVRNR